MEFAPAGEFIGAAHQVRIIEIVDSGLVPDGEYQFVDMYCIDPSCDCRKTMIQVLHNDQLVSIINFGWESSDYYCEWMGCSSDEAVSHGMDGASIDFNSPDLVSRKGMLALFNALLNETWLNNFKIHYAAVKKAIADQKKDTET